MAEQFVLLRLDDELIVSEGRYIRFHGGRGQYVKIGKWKDRDRDGESVYAFVFDGNAGWTEELAIANLKKSNIDWVKMTEESVDLPDYKNGEMQKDTV